MYSSEKIQDCISHIIGWYFNTFLLCNSAKAMVIQFSSKFINNGLIPSINIGANNVTLESTVCDLGVMLDKHFDMLRQDNNISKSASLAMRNIAKIINYFDQPTAENLSTPVEQVKLTFATVDLLFGLSKKQLDKLQRILNAAARNYYRLN